MAGVEAGVALGEQGTGPLAEIATLVFNDGSKYTGTLKNGTPDGLGTCVWKDGNQYDGEWRGGVMHGFGTYLWTSGQRYDGEWKDGKRDGVGVKMYADGSTFHGIWRDGKKHGVGVFKPAPREREKEKERGSKLLLKTASGRLLASAASLQDGDVLAGLRAGESMQHPDNPQAADLAARDPLGAADGASTSEAGGERPERVSLSGGRAPGDKGEKGDKADKERERDREREKEGKLVFIRAFDDGALRREEKLSSEDAKMIFGQKINGPDDKGSSTRKKVKRALGFGKKLQQKHGQLLYKGMPGYNLMLRLQQGIRWSVGRGTYLGGQQEPPHPPQPSGASGAGLGAPLPLSHVLKRADFTEKVKVFFPSAGSAITPAHPSGDFKWKDYCPRVFRNLRNMYGIADAEYMLSLGGSSALWQLNSPGKSGCMFFLSDDERFLVKTMRKTEIRTLIDMLPKYYSHMESEPHNLVIRFFGVHGVKQVHGRTVRFMVMHNMFNTDLQIHKKFDLKGSTDGRTTGPRVDPNDPKSVFKDLDLDLQFLVDPAAHAALIRQIAADAAFLRAVAVMDYSLLLGVHFPGRMRAAYESEAAAHAHAHPAHPHTHPQPPQVQAQGQRQGQQGPGVPPAPAAPAPAPAQALTPFAGAAAAAAAAVDGGRVVLGGASPPSVPLASYPPGGQALLQALDSRGSADGTDDALSGLRISPGARNGNCSPGAVYPAGRSGGGTEDAEGEQVRNFDLFSDRIDLDKQLALFEERMRGLGYGQQRMEDVLSLVRLRILGDRLKKRSRKAYKVYDGPATVLKALASRRHGAENLPRLEEGEEVLGGAASDDEDDAAPLPANAAARQPLNPGYKLRALAVHTRGGHAPEEVVLCFGIIDILQDWNARKVFERTFKSLTHDSYAISVAPPKLYSMRFADFLTKTVFMDPTAAAAKGLHLPPATTSMYGGYAPGFTTIEEEVDSGAEHVRRR